MIKTLFGGRINRKEFFLGLLLSFIFITVAGIVLGIIVKVIFQDAQWVGGLAGILFFVCIVLLTVKRLHDIVRSAWWALFLFPFAPFVMLYLLLAEGHAAANEYGLAPTNRKFSLHGILLNTSPEQEVLVPQNPASIQMPRKSNKVALLSVLAISPLGAVLPLFVFSQIGLCRIQISFGLSECTIPVIGGYLAMVQEWFVVVFLITFGIGNIVWLIGACVIWALLGIFLIRAVR